MEIAFITFNNLVSIAGLLADLITIFGLCLALKLFLREKDHERSGKLSRKEHILLVLKDGLDLIAPWAAKNEAGYPEYPPPQKIQEWSNPFRLIFKPLDSGLRQIPILEGITEFKGLYKLVLEVNQSISRMNDLQNQLVSVATSDIKASLRVDLSLSNPNISLTDDEQLLRDKVLNMNVVIHCGVIADGYRPGLKQSFHRLEMAVEKEMQQLGTVPQISFLENLLETIANLLLFAVFLTISLFLAVTIPFFYFTLTVLLSIIVLLILRIIYLGRFNKTKLDSTERRV